MWLPHRLYENCKKWVSPESIAKFANEFNVEPYRLFYRPIPDKELLKNFAADIHIAVLEAIDAVTSRYK